MVELVEGEGAGVTETKPEGGEFCAVVPLAPGSG